MYWGKLHIYRFFPLLHISLSQHIHYCYNFFIENHYAVIDPIDNWFEWMGLYMWWDLGLPRGTNRHLLEIHLTEAFALSLEFPESAFKWEGQLVHVPIWNFLSLLYFLWLGWPQGLRSRNLKCWMYLGDSKESRGHNLREELLLWCLWVVQFASDPSKGESLWRNDQFLVSLKLVYCTMT